VHRINYKSQALKGVIDMKRRLVQIKVILI
jgi:hypothetical protein